MELIKINNLISNRTFNYISASVLFTINLFISLLCSDIYYLLNYGSRGGWFTIGFNTYELITILLINLIGITASVLQLKSLLHTRNGIIISASAALVSFILAFIIFN